MRVALVTGAYKNAGDHLIGYRARTLIEHVSGGMAKVTTVDRKSISATSSAAFDEFDFVLLTGGPALRPHTFPWVYDLDFTKMHTPTLFYGVGTMSPLNTDPQNFQLEQTTLKSLDAMQSRTALHSSVRDYDSQALLRHHGFTNVAMTGCPAWYDLELLDSALQPPEEIEHVVISAPARNQRNFIGLIEGVARAFPTARKSLTFQAGFSIPSARFKGLLNDGQRWRRKAKQLDFEIHDFEADLDSMLHVLPTADLHVGYRVHQHLLSLSQRKLSLLISEDNRGISQSRTLQSDPLTSAHSSEEIMSAVLEEIDTDGHTSKRAVRVMQDSWPTMHNYLSQFLST